MREQSEQQVELVGLGLVVPAYNEEERLPDMLRTHIDFMLKE